MKKKCTAGIFILLILRLSFCNDAFALPVQVTDTNGRSITIQKTPARVVCLVPSVTEILFQINAGNAVSGMTYHDKVPPGTLSKPIVGGYFSPSVRAIEALRPDMIILSDIHTNVKERFSGSTCVLIEMKTTSVSGSLADIILLGKIFNQETRAEELVTEIRQELEQISLKVAKIPQENRKRVIRLMGRNEVMTPGTDSFQNEMIRAAGGITHDFHKNGDVISITKEEWIRFNPQVIYGCGGDRKTAESFFSRPGWKDVDAVKNNRIYYFPCDLTCRAATHTGYFVSWLAANIYGDFFSRKDNLVQKEETIVSRLLQIDLDYLNNVRILRSRIYDFFHKTLVIDFKKPLSIVSTLEGERAGIQTVGNHFSPPQYWAATGHMDGLEGHRKRIYSVLGRDEKNTSFLFTGADMDNLSIQQESFKEMTVHALVTAGVEGNAMRMARDEGLFYEPGTINIIIMTNMRLTARAMTRAIITATEAKTAALLDMDIRSSFGSGAYRATGTGTDNVMVVEGTGIQIDNAGGHTKLGELIARAVYAGVQEAVDKQNRLTAKRNIFQRLKERDISVYGLIGTETCDCGRDRNDFSGAVEELLLDPQYAGFMESALALNDDHDKGLITDLALFRQWGQLIAEQVAGRKIQEIKNLTMQENLSPVMKIAFDSLLTGIYYREQEAQAE
ncbi:MAG: adenosylcobinamide amidohydrolase [Pseudomonadota bacterium]